MTEVQERVGPEKVVEIRHMADKESAVQTGRRWCDDLGFPGEDQEKVALVVCELGTNGVKYGKGRAKISFRRFQNGNYAGLEIEYAAPGGDAPTDKPISLGIGLDVIRNHVDEFQLGNGPDMNLVVRKHLPNRNGLRWRASVSAFTHPSDGEVENGDGFSVERTPGKILITVFDGLGHGPQASKVSTILNQVFVCSPGWDLEALVRRAQSKLAGTRGSAIAAVSIDLYTGRGEYMGVGNVETRWLSSSQRISLVPVPGILGRPRQRLKKEPFQLEEPGVFLLSSDGISLRHLDADMQEVDKHDPFAIANYLLRERYRPHDDRTVLAARFTRNPAVK